MHRYKRVNSLAGKVNYCGIVWNKRFRVTVKRKQPREFDKQKNISSEHCVVDYKNINDLEKQSGFCTAAVAQYCAPAAH